MYLKSILKTAALATVLLSSSYVSAGLLTLESYHSGVSTPDVIGGFTMTDFNLSNDVLSGSTSSVNSPISGAIEFERRNGASLGMTRRTADTTNWWQNGENTDYDIFTTGVNLIRIILPENTRAFSFNVGADLSSSRNNAWLEAEGYSQTNGDPGSLQRENFNVNRNNTPGFGLYADNSNGSCGVISSVVVDPEFWGIGNFSINQSECVADVPEPGSLGLLGLGLFCLVAMRRKV